MTLPLAHTGHWITEVLTLVPIVGFAVWLGINVVRQRLRERRQAAAAGSDERPE